MPTMQWRPKLAIASLSRRRLSSRSPISIMPEGQLKTLKEQEIRDLFAYLMKP